jgi:hypothetical protein
MTPVLADEGDQHGKGGGQAKLPDAKAEAPHY